MLHFKFELFVNSIVGAAALGGSYDVVRNYSITGI